MGDGSVRADAPFFMRPSLPTSRVFTFVHGGDGTGELYSADRDGIPAGRAPIARVERRMTTDSDGTVEAYVVTPARELRDVLTRGLERGALVCPITSVDPLGAVWSVVAAMAGNLHEEAARRGGKDKPASGIFLRQAVLVRVDEGNRYRELVRVERTEDGWLTTAYAYVDPEDGVKPITASVAEYTREKPEYMVTLLRQELNHKGNFDIE